MYDPGPSRPDACSIHAAAEQAEFRRLSALAQSKRSGGASDVNNSSGISSAPSEIGPDQLQSPPARDPHQ